METREMILCVPGSWADRRDFMTRVIKKEPVGKYLFAGMILADTQDNDHVPLEFFDADPDMSAAFEAGGQGQIPNEVLQQVAEHSSVAYLRFPSDVLDQRERILKYSQFLQRIGGLAVKLESAGIAHSWERWFELLCGNSFDIYCACVVLAGDEDQYYSCGMHHFGLPDCIVPTSISPDDAANLMNQFNYWQIEERPTVDSGQTFSLSKSAPRFRLQLTEDPQFESDHPYHNPHGVWRLSAV